MCYYFSDFFLSRFNLCICFLIQSTKVKYEKIPTLRTMFKHPKDASHKPVLTAANSSPMSDGACALVISSGKALKGNKGKNGPIARIIAIADAELAPEDFPIAPAKAIKLACKRYVCLNSRRA